MQIGDRNKGWFKCPVLPQICKTDFYFHEISYILT